MGSYEVAAVYPTFLDTPLYGLCNLLTLISWSGAQMNGEFSRAVIPVYSVSLHVCPPHNGVQPPGTASGLIRV